MGAPGLDSETWEPRKPKHKKARGHRRGLLFLPTRHLHTRQLRPLLLGVHADLLVLFVAVHHAAHEHAEGFLAALIEKLIAGLVEVLRDLGVARLLLVHQLGHHAGAHGIDRPTDGTHIHVEELRSHLAHSAKVGNLAVRAQEKATEMPAASTAPTSGPRAEFLEEIAYYEQRYTKLAEAMPAEKYGWRPGEGVRSVGEVYAHIVAANYGVARALGTQPPAGLDMKSVMSLANDKPKLMQALKDSFAHFRGAILALSDADADKPQKMFNRQTTVRGAFMMIDRHWGEHLGQSIAYARINGVVPPWTAEFQQQQPAAKPKL